MPISFPKRTITALAIAVSISSGTAACNGSSSQSSGATTDFGSGRSSAARPVSAASRGRASVGAAHKIDICALVTAGRASQLDGHKITNAGPATGLGSGAYGCAYSNDDGTVQIQLEVIDQDAASTFATLSDDSRNKTAVSDLGDKAFYDNDQTLYALSGSHLVQANGCDSAEHCAALARTVLSAL